MADDGARRAVFLDRDGTIVDDPGFLHRAADVRLLPGAAEAVARLNRAGWLVVTASNQSGIARGLYDDAAYHTVQRRLATLLAEHGARLDGAYHCPHHPSVAGPCACRKPATGMFEQAARELGVDLRRSWYVGDRTSDIEPASALGGRGALVLTGLGPDHAARARERHVPVVRDLAAAADLILGGG
jgi:D-glycero-D-manno-heptose 1,7-bisphosphate phosphatase